MKSWKVPLAFGVLAIVQLLLFSAFVQREVAWNYDLHGDPNWYVYFNYKLYNAFVERSWGVFWDQAIASPWGMLLFLETLVPQFLFGASRFSVGVINLFYFIAAQIFVYAFFARMTRSAIGGVVAVTLLMAMGTTFHKEGNTIVDFHFDLALFFLLIVLHLLVAWSNTFAIRNRAVVVGVFAGITIATRLVSVFLISGIVAVFIAYLLYRRFYRSDVGSGVDKARLSGIAFAIMSCVATFIVPLLLGARALFWHHFRPLFDKSYMEVVAETYRLGATSKFESIYEMLFRIAAYDFGAGYLVVLLVAVVVAVVAWRFPPLVSGSPGADGRSGHLPGFVAGMLADREAVRTFAVFICASAAVSFLIHLAYIAQSTNLTRMTAAPVLVGVLMLLVPPIVRMWNASADFQKKVARVLVGALVASSLWVQLDFYTGPGFRHAEKTELMKVSRIYDDISRVAALRELKAVAISVDRIGSALELGAMLTFPIYEFEKNGRFLAQIPKVGGSINNSFSKEQTLKWLGESDVVLLGPLPYPKSREPFMASMALMADDVHKFVKANFCLYRDYKLFGDTRQLYVNLHRNAWKYSASAATEKRFGPEGLLEGVRRIWHAPWGGDATQWVEFEHDIPVQFTALGMMAQDGAPTRAPRDFALEAFDVRQGWTRILAVKGADFSVNQTINWPVSMERPYRRFRLTVTRNGGDPTLMTIQDLKLEIVGGLSCHGQEAIAGR